MWPKLFLFSYNAFGLLIFPLLCLYSKARRHIFRLPTPSPGCIWVHGASAGEHQAARALCQELDAPFWRTFSSWRTPILDAFPAPLDIPFLRNRWLDKARPKMLILIEAELWPGWLAACRLRKIPIVVVNARPSSSETHWSKIGLWRWLTKDITFIPIEKTGDLKTAAPIQPPPFELNRNYILGASTHPSEEEALLKAWSLLNDRPLLILAPRRIERTNAIALLCEDYQVQKRSEHPLHQDTEILILDSFGELATLYPKAACAFIGGTLIPEVGGHSPAEAIAAGTAYIYGPYIQKNRKTFELGNGIKVSAPDELKEAIQRAMQTDSPPQHADLSILTSALPPNHCPQETDSRPFLKPIIPLWVWWGSRQPNYATPPEKSEIPVISVGGLSAGGSGKTPISGWLASQGNNIWISSRGYRRPVNGPLLRTKEGLGDEAEMLRRRGFNVISCPDRQQAARYAAENGATAIIIDDGYQYRRLQRQLNICCIDMRWPRSRGQIPVGWARESWAAHERANILWLHHHDPDLPCPPLSNRPRIRSRLQPSHWLHQGKSYPLHHVRGPVPIAVGIAHPSAFITTLHQMGIQISHQIIVGDHRPFPTLPSGCIMTEKDAARLSPNADIWALCMRLEIDNPQFIQEQLQICISSHML